MLVSFGSATLVVSDTAERPLTHWSLPAVMRLNPGTTPAIFSPGPDSVERLEIDDAEMIEAIEAVRGALGRAQPRPGRLRTLLTLALLAAAGIAAASLGPDALRSQARGATPAAQRAELGARILGHMQARTGPACREARGTAALARLRSRLGTTGQAVVLPAALPGPVVLPGGIAVIGQATLARYDDPAVAAGELLSARASVEDPLDPLLRQAGLRATVTLMTTGDLPAESLRDYADRLLDGPVPVPSEARLLERFARARISPAAYAPVRTERGQDAALLLTQTPPEGGAVVLSDEDWIRLQGICDL
ncbi:hypothetical protein EU805_10570 [Salipiger sp. IMCC34102]|nr:hypothetical protein EU805_10570 [Salipiger sp. IMCC34102]